MKSINNSLVVIVALVAIFFGTLSLNKAQAVDLDQSPEVCFCHNVNSEPQTVCTSDSETMSLHSQHVTGEIDTLGACQEEEISPTPTPIPTGNLIEDNIFDVCIPFITDCVTPTVTPTPTVEVRVTPTPTVTPEPTSVPVGGSSNNPSTTSSSNPSTGGGEVLGATTLGKTGVFEETLANFAMLAGTLMMGASSMLYGKKNK